MIILIVWPWCGMRDSQAQEGEIILDFQASKLAEGVVVPQNVMEASMEAGGLAAAGLYLSVSSDELVRVERMDVEGNAAMRIDLPFPPADRASLAASLTVNLDVNTVRLDPAKPLNIELKLRRSGSTVSINTMAVFTAVQGNILLPLGGVSANANQAGIFVLPSVGGELGVTGAEVPLESVVTIGYRLSERADGLFVQNRLTSGEGTLLEEEVKPDVPTPLGVDGAESPEALSLTHLRKVSVTFSHNVRGEGSETVDVLSFRAWQ